MVGQPSAPVPEPDPAAVAAARTVADLALLLRVLRRREARQRAGAELTYRQLAARAGWSHAVVAGYLTGKTLPPVDRFDRLIQILGATPAEQRALATARDRVEEVRRALTGPCDLHQRLPVPRQVPADVPDFAGRDRELAALDALLEAAERRSTAVTAVVTGTAGVGKTALAVHWAHRVGRRFNHGQLYADLRGFAPEAPAPPERVLDAYLTALGVPVPQLPGHLDAKAALFRSLLDGRRLLVLLDNAADPEQVRPLLPATPGSVVVVTSRDTLTGLVARDRAHRVHLDVLPVDDAVRLLAGFVGEAAAEADRTAARQLAALCSFLPVALCAAGVRAAAAGCRAGLAGVVDDLARAGAPLDLLAAGDDGRAAVRSVFSWSYRRLPADAARIFRLLGWWNVDDVGADEVAAIAGVQVAEAARLIDVLVSANLLRREEAGRCRLLDLLRGYAAELAERHDVTAAHDVVLPSP
jgi:transcriptional regulator with XRE-family HTH domain